MRTFTILIAIFIFAATQIEAKVYGFIIGVDNYVYQKNLRHAKDDAILFYATLKHINPLMDVEWNVLLDDDATPENIVAHLIRYIKVIKEEDTFIFYYSGHGSDEGIYVSDSYMKSGMLPYEDLKLGIKYISAKEKLIFMDACNSAAIIKKKLTAYENEKFRTYSTARSSNKTGQNTILFLGSGVAEESMELGIVGHGLFTFFLCAGLRGEADFNKDNYVQIDELFYFFRNNTFATSKIISTKYQCPLLIGNFDKKLVIANLN
ncbi:MAG: caspase family protein [Saprospiraceae bacterium]|nr:caspase family protein [Saprospiraceae bacterium]